MLPGILCFHRSNEGPKTVIEEFGRRAVRAKRVRPVNADDGSVCDTVVASVSAGAITAIDVTRAAANERCKRQRLRTFHHRLRSPLIALIPAQLSSISSRDGQRFVFLVSLPPATPASTSLQR